MYKRKRGRSGKGKWKDEHADGSGTCRKDEAEGEDYVTSLFAQELRRFAVQTQEYTPVKYAEKQPSPPIFFYMRPVP